MNIIIEFDGLIADQQEAWYRAHVASAEAVGWSRLDSGTFRRLVRTQGRQADMLPAARPGKVEEYWQKFDLLTESDEYIGAMPMVDECAPAITALARLSEIRVVTLGTNVSARTKLLTKYGIARFIKQTERLDSDPRRRPAELKLLAKSNRRTLLVAASDALIRSAGAAELISVGISSGHCTGPRMHQAGAGLVYKELAELVNSLETGAHDLIRMGLPPRSLDAPTA